MTRQKSDRDRIWKKLQPDLQDIQADRKRRRPFGLGCILLGLVALIGAVWGGLQVEDGPWRVGAIALGFTGLVAQLIGFGQLNLHGSRFELLARNAVFAQAGLSFKRAVSEFPTKPFQDLGLIPDYDEARFRDHVTGEIAGLSFQMCHAELIKRISKRSSKTPFKGVLLSSAFHKPIIGRTTVFPDPTKTGYVPAWNATEGERVRLESSAFEDLYEVYSSDQVAARYLLTPSFMERLMAVQTQLQERDHNAIVCLGLTDGHLLLAIFGERAWFEGPKGRPDLDDPSIIDNYLGDLDRLRDVIKTLNLDARPSSGSNSHRG
jgi:hypothetical protein